MYSKLMLLLLTVMPFCMFASGKNSEEIEKIKTCIKNYTFDRL
jgi:hypothetical protein